MMKRETLSRFLDRCADAGIDLSMYDYSDSVHRGRQTKMRIRCIKHDMHFEQSPYNHIRGKDGCPQCIFNAENYIDKCEEAHPGRYTYYRGQYGHIRNMRTPIRIYCNRCEADIVKRKRVGGALVPSFGISLEHHITHRIGCNCYSAEAQQRGRQNREPNRTLADFYPHLVAELAPEDQHVAYRNAFAHVKAWWICERHGLYDMDLRNRTAGGQGCPYCSNMRPCADNNFSNNPDCDKWWDYELNKRPPHEYLPCSTHHAWFKCDCVDDEGRESIHPSFHMRICNFAHGERCPYKAGKRVCHQNSLLNFNPAIAAIWDYERNTHLADGPSGVTYGSAILCWFKCPKGHRFRSAPNNLKDTTGCVHCNDGAGYSRVSIEWLESLGIPHLQYALSPEGEYRIPETRWRADGYDYKTNTIYEFHGSYWHADPAMFDPYDIHPTFGYECWIVLHRTLAREAAIRQMGYNLVVMWESDYRRQRGKK